MGKIFKLIAFIQLCIIFIFILDTHLLPVNTVNEKVKELNPTVIRATKNSHSEIIYIVISKSNTKYDFGSNYFSDILDGKTFIAQKSKLFNRPLAVIYNDKKIKIGILNTFNFGFIIGIIIIIQSTLVLVVLNHFLDNGKIDFLMGFFIANLILLIVAYFR